MLSGLNPCQLLMVIPGEGGVGKSKMIQTITENFEQHGVAHLLAKSAYTGITATIIDGKTLHVIAQIPINGQECSQRATKKLIIFWQHHLYLIINEKSMLSHKFLTCISAPISKAKSLAGVANAEVPFGGANIILIRDFHQFPPVISRPVYWLIDPLKDDGKELLGRSLYEQFHVVVHLTQQVQVIDGEWIDLLHHIRNGSCHAHHIKMLQSLVITNPGCVPTDFSTTP